MLVFVALLAGAGTIPILDIRYLGHLDLSSRGGRGPIDGVVAVNGRILVAAALVDDRLLVFRRDPDQGTLSFLDAARHPFMVDPVHVTAAPFGSDFYVASLGSDTVTHWRHSQPGFGNPNPPIGLEYRGSAPSPAGAVDLVDPVASVLVRGGSELWVVGLNDARLFRYPIAVGGALQTPLVQDLQIMGARDLVLTPDGSQVLIADFAGDSLVVLDVPATGSPVVVQRLTHRVAGVTGLDAPYDLVVDSSGADVYVAEFDGPGISHFHRSGTGQLSFGSSLRSTSVPTLNGANSVTLSANGTRLYSAGGVPGRLHEFRRNGDGSLTVLGHLDDSGPLAGHFAGLSGTWRWGDSLYVANLSGREIVHFDLGSGGPRLVEAQGGLESVADFELGVASPSGERVFLLGYNPSGPLRGGGLGPLGSFDLARDRRTGGLTPTGFHSFGVSALDPVDELATSPGGGDVYAVSSFGSSLIQLARSDTGLVLVDAVFDGLGGVDGLGGAADVLVSPDAGHVYVAGAADGRIARFARAASGILTFQGTTVVAGTPAHLEMGPDGLSLIVALSNPSGPDQIQVFGRNVSTGGLALSSSASVPASSAIALEEIDVLRLTRDGRHLLLGSWDDANRRGVLTVFSRQLPSGALGHVQTVVTGVDSPNELGRIEDLSLIQGGRQLVVADGADAGLELFWRGSGTGQLSWRGRIGNRREESVGSRTRRFLEVDDGRHLYGLHAPRVGIFSLASIFADGFESGTTDAW